MEEGKKEEGIFPKTSKIYNLNSFEMEEEKCPLY